MKGFRLDHIVTEMGSQYKYLDDGRTQRFKAVENDFKRPQDVLVFVPNYEWIKANAPEDYVRETFGTTSHEYNQTLLSYVLSRGKRCYVVDAEGKSLGVIPVAVSLDEYNNFRNENLAKVVAIDVVLNIIEKAEAKLKEYSEKERKRTAELKAAKDRKDALNGSKL